jgi:ABC-type tungstate transport system permease subunit
MSDYIYTPRAEVKQMKDGVKVARLGFAYKDFNSYAPAAWFRSAGRQESAGQKAAEKHNAQGVSLLARCDKFEVGAPVYEIHNNHMHFKYSDYNMGNMEVVGEMAKRGREWYVKYNA